MVVSVTDIFMRQVKLMELLSNPAPSAEFQQKTHGSHLLFPMHCMICPGCRVGLIEKRIQVPWTKTDLTALICVPWFMELLQNRIVANIAVDTSYISFLWKGRNQVEGSHKDLHLTAVAVQRQRQEVARAVIVSRCDGLPTFIFITNANNINIITITIIKR